MLEDNYHEIRNENGDLIHGWDSGDIKLIKKGMKAKGEYEASKDVRARRDDRGWDEDYSHSAAKKRTREEEDEEQRSKGDWNDRRKYDDKNKASSSWQGDDGRRYRHREEGDKRNERREEGNLPSGGQLEKLMADVRTLKTDLYEVRNETTKEKGYAKNLEHRVKSLEGELKQSEKTRQSLLADNKKLEEDLVEHGDKVNYLIRQVGEDNANPLVVTVRQLMSSTERVTTQLREWSCAAGRPGREDACRVKSELLDNEEAAVKDGDKDNRMEEDGYRGDGEAEGQASYVAEGGDAEAPMPQSEQHDEAMEPQGNGAQP
jgi:hypothetical protein